MLTGEEESPGEMGIVGILIGVSDILLVAALPNSDSSSEAISSSITCR